MRYIFLLTISFFIFSCSNGSNPKPTPCPPCPKDTTIVTQKPDTATVVKTISVMDYTGKAVSTYSFRVPKSSSATVYPNIVLPKIDPILVRDTLPQKFVDATGRIFYGGKGDVIKLSNMDLVTQKGDTIEVKARSF